MHLEKISTYPSELILILLNRLITFQNIVLDIALIKVSLLKPSSFKTEHL